MIVKGIVALLMRVLNHRTPDEILDADLYFINNIGLQEHLSPRDQTAWWRWSARSATMPEHSRYLTATKNLILKSINYMFKNHPKGLIPAALSNMGERFGYYIMNAVLVLFLCSKFGLAEETSALIYSFFYAGIYVLSLVGGIIADKTQNYKSTIIWGLIVMTLGYVVLSISYLRHCRQPDVAADADVRSALLHRIRKRSVQG